MSLPFTLDQFRTTNQDSAMSTRDVISRLQLNPIPDLVATESWLARPSADFKTEWASVFPTGLPRRV
jgi:hypothetical protein